MAQTGTISGTITSIKKEPLLGATVRVKGTSLGASADFDGKFIIKEVPIGKQTLSVSYIGYQQQDVPVEVKAGDNALPNIVLKEDQALLNEVVVVGYGTQVKREMSSSVSEVKADVIGDKPVYDFTSALQGQAAGVQITTDNGLAGAAVTVRIRGTKSLSNSAEPLYVIDGVPIVSYDISVNALSAQYGYNTSPLANINPADIENVVVLKDAAATAIYGSRGANGVIIVTTKQGRAGKPKVDFSFQTGISQAAHIISLLDGPQYQKLWKQALQNDGLSTAGPISYGNGITSDNAANTNWLKQLLTIGHYEDANFSISGGNEKTTYYMGMGFRDDKSFMVGNKFQRASFRANLNHEVNKYFSAGFNSSLSYSNNHYVPSAEAGGLGSAESIMLPVYPVYNKDGSYFAPNINPVAIINSNQSENNTFSTVSDVWAEVKPLPGLTFRNEFGINMINQLENFFTSPVVLLGDTGIASDRRDFYMTWNLNTTLDYKKDFNDDNSLDVLVGFNPTETTEKYSFISETNFPVSTVNQPQQGQNVLSATAGTGRQYAFVSFFARVNYNLLQRFLFQVSVRADGSSRFAEGHRYGYFPALSIGWIMTQEKFMAKATQKLSFFKVRASAGTTGNADMSTDWAYLSGYGGGQNYAGFNGIGPTSLAVPGLTWQTTLKTDLGFDYGFLNNRISGALDLYQENTNNVLISSAPLTPSSGFSTTVRNIGALYNRGIEFNISTSNLGPGSPLKWKTTLNISSNQSKVTDLGAGVSSVSGTNFGNNRAIVGYPVGVWLLAQYAGIDPETGKTLIDSSGVKVVATAGNTVSQAKPVGRPYPYFFGGLTNNFEYKGFDLSITLTFSVGNQIYDDDGKRQNGNFAFGWNQLTTAENAWTTPSQVTDIPKLSTVNNYDLNTTRYLHDASYLRLRTLTLGYSLPLRTLSKMKMRQLRFYISAQNLAVATKYKGWDPETNRSSSGAITQGVSYLNSPQARIFSFGFNVGF